MLQRTSSAKVFPSHTNSSQSHYPWKTILFNITHLPHDCGENVVTWGTFAECQTRDRKVASSNPSRSGGRIFFSSINFVCWLLFSVHSTSVLLQWHIKDPGHSARRAGGRLHLNMHTPLTRRSRSGLTMPLSRHSVGLYPEMRSQVIWQGTFDHNCPSSLSCCGLILAQRVELMCASLSPRKK